MCIRDRDICNQYAKKDSRIKIVNKENGGLSDARNSGLKDATGDFVVFVDSDDLLSIDFCEKLLSHATKNNADIVECNYTKFKREEDLNQDSNTFNSEIEIHDTAEALKSLMHQNLKQVVWNKLYRKEVINNIQFPIGRINEDEFWTYKIFGNAKKVIKIPDFLYFYRQQEGSIMAVSYTHLDVYKRQI